MVTEFEKMLPDLKEAIDKKGEYIFNFSPKGNSMHPLIKQCFHVVHLKRAEKIRKFDILLYQRDNGNFVIHRVMKTKGDTLTMCGDNQIYKEKGIRFNQVLGIVSSLVTPDGRVIKCYGAKNYAYSLLIRLKMFFKRCFEFIKRRIK